MYIPEHFQLQELFPQDFYEQYYPQRGANLWELIDHRVLRVFDGLRTVYGPIVVNDWMWGGKNNYRGYRPPGCKIGARLSQHRFGRAGDGIPSKTTAEKIRQDIMKHRKDINDNNMDPAIVFEHPSFRYITAFEIGISWLHFDVRNRNVSKFGIKTFEAI